VDGRADIYSLGAVAYFLTTGQTPFTSKNVLELLAAHRDTEVPAPSQLNPAIPADLEQIILKCMAKNPSDRFQGADSLRSALERCSVADKWGSEEAANWWNSIGEQPVGKPLNTAPMGQHGSFASPARFPGIRWRG
jgi:serine/threonine-protein kinase